MVAELGSGVDDREAGGLFPENLMKHPELCALEREGQNREFGTLMLLLGLEDVPQFFTHLRYSSLTSSAKPMPPRPPPGFHARLDHTS